MRSKPTYIQRGVAPSGGLTGNSRVVYRTCMTYNTLVSAGIGNIMKGNFNLAADIKGTQDWLSLVAMYSRIKISSVTV